MRTNIPKCHSDNTACFYRSKIVYEIIEKHLFKNHNN